MRPSSHKILIPTLTITLLFEKHEQLWPILDLIRFINGASTIVLELLLKKTLVHSISWKLYKWLVLNVKNALEIPFLSAEVLIDAISSQVQHDSDIFHVEI